MIGKFARACVLAFIVTAPAGASAGTAYDGAWSLSIVTERGTCDRYNFPVRIANGQVSFPGLVKAHGRVSRKGSVRVLRVDGVELVGVHRPEFQVNAACIRGEHLTLVSMAAGWAVFERLLIHLPDG